MLSDAADLYNDHPTTFTYNVNPDIDDLTLGSPSFFFSNEWGPISDELSYTGAIETGLDEATNAVYELIEEVSSAGGEIASSADDFKT